MTLYLLISMFPQNKYCSKDVNRIEKIHQNWGKQSCTLGKKSHLGQDMGSWTTVWFYTRTRKREGAWYS